MFRPKSENGTTACESFLVACLICGYGVEALYRRLRREGKT
jgi:hypothetical protein